MTGQDGLRDELVAALEAIDNLADNNELADRLLPVVQARIDAAREKGFKAADFEERRAVLAERRAEAAEKAVQRVRAVVDEWGDADPDKPNHGLWIAIRRALDGTP